MPALGEKGLKDGLVAVDKGGGLFGRAQASFPGSLAAMLKPNHRRPRLPELTFEPLEARALLSLLITDRPTLSVQAIPHRVVPDHRGGFRVLGPAVVQVFGSAQPTINVEAQVGFFAQDLAGNILNDAQPLAVVNPNELGRYAAAVPLPASLAGQTIELVALEVANGTLASTIVIPPTALTGLSGSLQLSGAVLFGLGGALSLEPGMITNLGATLTTSSGGITGLSGGISNPGASITLSNGTTGTLGSSLSTLAGGTGTLTPLTGNLTGGTGIESHRLGNFTGGSGTLSASSGQFTQAGSGAVAGTTAEQSTPILEYAASDPVTLHVQPARAQLRAAAFHRRHSGK